jgi:hypothetical protein
VLDAFHRLTDEGLDQQGFRPLAGMPRALR